MPSQQEFLFIDNYPFNPAKPLHLHIDNIRFTHTQITSCALL